ERAESASPCPRGDAPSREFISLRSAASVAAAPVSAVGRESQRPSSRSKITVPGTIGTIFSGDSSPSTGKPMPAASRTAIAPSAAPRPEAEAPHSAMAWIRSTVLCGSSRSVSRVPGPPPRTSTEATAPAGAAIIVAPESPSPPSLIACPTPRPRTSISELLGPGWVPNNSADSLDLARRTVIRVLWILWPLVGGLAPALRRAVPWVIHQLCRQLPHHRLQQAVLVESQPSDQLLGCLNTVRPLRAVQRGLAELVIVIPHVVDSREPGLDFLLA